MFNNSKIKSFLLFYGELPPSVFHGISISNETNLYYLDNHFDIDIINEVSNLKNHKSFSIDKTLNVLLELSRIIFASIKQHYSYFYLVLSLSSFGSVKTLISILCFKVFNRGKVIIHIHRGDFYNWYYKCFFNKLVFWCILKLIYKVIVLSEKAKIDMENVFGNKFTVLTNTIEAEMDLPNRKNNNYSFIYISNYIEEKGIMVLLNVFKELSISHPEIILQTYGAFANEDLKSQILNFNSPNIKINESIYGKDKFDLLANVDCLILPSWNEGQPIVLLESMSVGTPIIASEVGLIPDLLGENYPFLIKPNNCESLKDGIIKFINSTDIENLSFNLRKIYYEKYSRMIHERDLINIFIRQ